MQTDFSRRREPIIEVHSLVKSFGPRIALSGVDLSVEAGEFIALVGPNGSGKTTLLRVLATLTRPTSGVVRVAGLDPARAGEEVRRHIGFLSHRTLLYEDLTAEQNLHFYARMYGLDAGEQGYPPTKRLVQDLLAQVGLAGRGYGNLLVRTFSRGMKQRLAVARAVLHRPQVLLLDEPYAGLDPQGVQVLTDLLIELVERGCTVLLTTHDLRRGLAVGHRIVVLARGRVVHDEGREAVDPAAFPQTYRALVG